MWKKLGKLLAKAAVWCVKNPDDIIQVVTIAKKAKGGDDK